MIYIYNICMYIHTHILLAPGRCRPIAKATESRSAEPGAGSALSLAQRVRGLHPLGRARIGSGVPRATASPGRPTPSRPSGHVTEFALSEDLKPTV